MLKSGQRVRLKPCAVEGQPEEWGVVVDGPYRTDMYLVEVDAAFRGYIFAGDGLREVPEKDVTLCLGDDEIGHVGVRCHCDLCRTVDCGHVAGKFDMDCPECRMPVMP